MEEVRKMGIVIELLADTLLRLSKIFSEVRTGVLWAEELVVDCVASYGEEIVEKKRWKKFWPG